MIKKQPLTKNRLTLPDGAVIAVLLALAVIFLNPFWEREAGVMFTITAEGSQTAKYPLHEDARFTVTSCGVSLQIEVKDGRVAVVDADCPDGICVSTGWIDRAGEAIVCIPAKAVITIVANEGAESEGQYEEYEENEDFIAG